MILLRLSWRTHQQFLVQIMKQKLCVLSALAEWMGQFSVTTATFPFVGTSAGRAQSTSQSVRCSGSWKRKCQWQHLVLAQLILFMLIIFIVNFGIVLT